jgi:hypothetical protein
MKEEKCSLECPFQSTTFEQSTHCSPHQTRGISTCIYAALNQTNCVCFDTDGVLEALEVARVPLVPVTRHMHTQPPLFIVHYRGLVVPDSVEGDLI